MTTIAPLALVVGKNRLLLRKSSSTGHFLVEVAFWQAWDHINFFNEICHKAELPQGNCRELDAKLFSFESESWIEN